MKQVRCNRADDPKCPKCKHMDSHEPKDCTNWTECYSCWTEAEGQRVLFKVRCQKLG